GSLCWSHRVLSHSVGFCFRLNCHLPNPQLLRRRQHHHRRIRRTNRPPRTQRRWPHHHRRPGCGGLHRQHRSRQHVRRERLQSQWRRIHAVQLPAAFLLGRRQDHFHPFRRRSSHGCVPHLCL